MGVCILDLVSLLWGSGYILPHGGLLILLVSSSWAILLGDRFFTSGVLVMFLSSLSLRLILILGGKACGFGSTLYDELHWAEGKYQAFWRDGKASDSAEQGGEAFCWV